MKKKIALILAIAMVLTMMLSVPAMAAGKEFNANNVAALISHMASAEAGDTINIFGSGQWNKPLGTIKEGVTVIIPEGCTINMSNIGDNFINNGVIIVKGTLNLYRESPSGISTQGLVNNGVIDFSEGNFGIGSGTVASGQMRNFGKVYIREGQNLFEDYWTFNGAGKVIKGSYDPDAADETIAGTTGASAAYLDEAINYTLWVDAAEVLKSVNGISVTVTVNDILAYSDYEVLLPGFELINGPNWAAVEGGWKGTFELGLAGGGIDIDDYADLLTLSFQAREAGDATLTLNNVSVWTRPDVNAKDVIVNPAIPEETASVTTAVAEVPEFVPTYSVYDINKDEVVDFSDVVITLRAFGLTAADEGWNTETFAIDNLDEAVTAAMCDVNGDGVVDMLDVGDIVARYGNAPYELVDPRV